MKGVIFACLAILAIQQVSCQSNSTTTTTTTTKSTPQTTTTAIPTTHQPTTTTANTTQPCSGFKDCDSCVSSSQAKCVFCNYDNTCREALSLGLFDIGKVCKGGLSKTSWGTCSVNMMALIIGMSVVGGVLLISVCCCVCCCCCKNKYKDKLKWVREDAANQRKSDERKAKYAERRAERQAKNDEIRKKYGLFKDSSSYQRFDNDNDA